MGGMVQGGMVSGGYGPRQYSPGGMVPGYSPRGYGPGGMVPFPCRKTPMKMLPSRNFVCGAVTMFIIPKGLYDPIKIVVFNDLLTEIHIDKCNLRRNYKLYQSIGGSKGGRQGRALPPRGSKFFHFHAVFGKNVKNNSNFGSWRPPLGKILDPPLQSHDNIFHNVTCYYFFNRCQKMNLVGLPPRNHKRPTKSLSDYRQPLLVTV